MVANSIQDHISKFFDFSEPNEGDYFSPLNLLVRQKNLCLSGRVAVWPGVITILSGVDMLGFYLKAGNILSDTKQRFLDFYNEFFSIQSTTLDCGDILYSARCAMMHTFGLYTEKRDGTIIKFVFSWDNPVSDFITSIPSSSSCYVYHINLSLLNGLFDDAISNYRVKLINEYHNDPNSDIVQKFEEVYRKIGLIYNPYNPTTTGSAIPGSAIFTP